MREVPDEKRLIDGDVLKSPDSLAWLDVEHPVNQKKRIPVRQVFEDRANV
jgi:hypothetical protein